MEPYLKQDLSQLYKSRVYLKVVSQTSLTLFRPELQVNNANLSLVVKVVYWFALQPLCGVTSENFIENLIPSLALFEDV